MATTHHEQDLSSTGPFTSKPLIEQRRGSLAQMFLTTTSSLQQSAAQEVREDPMDQDWPPPPPPPPLESQSIHNGSAMPFGRRRSSSCNMLTTPSIVGGAASKGHGGVDRLLNVHTLYKIKRRKFHLFGSQQQQQQKHDLPPAAAPILSSSSLSSLPLLEDVSIAEIRREGVKGMLQSKIPICYFLYHLLQEISSENLFFFTEIEQYESFTYMTLVQQLATAQHIYDTYLSPNSHFEVNIDERIRHAVQHALQEKQVQGCFDPAKQAVYALLESSFMRFIDTPIWYEMVKQCGEETMCHNEETKHAAVNTLLRYIEQQHAMLYTNPHMDAPLSMCMQTAKKRHDLTKSMVHEFCLTVVGVEFQYYNIWSTRQDEHEDHLEYHHRQSSSSSSFMTPSSSMSSLSSHSRSGSSQLIQALKRPRQVVEAFDFFAKKKK